MASHLQPRGSQVRVTEKKVENFLREGVEERGGLCLKWVSPGCAGVPDDIVLMKVRPYENPEAIFVETKAPGGKLRPAQVRCHARLRALGYRVEVLSSLPEVSFFLCSL